MNLKPIWRKRAKAALEVYFRERSYPRTVLSLVLLVTGLAGLLFSYVMLHAGLGDMWLRYPLAVLCSYGVLLSLIRVWVALERSRFNPESLSVDANAEESGQAKPFRSLTSEPSWFDYLNMPDFGDFDLDEGCLPVVLVGLLGALAAVLIAAIVAAPALIGEVFLDAFLLSVLYRRLRAAERQHWLGTAIRKTWTLVLLTALILSLGGWILGEMAPGARTLGQAVEQIRTGVRQEL